MKRESSIEPGLLSIFRLFTVLWLAAELLTVVMRFVAGELPMQPYSLFIDATNAFLLLIYLSLPWLEHRLGRAFLPIGLLIATAGPMVSQALFPLQFVGRPGSRFLAFFLSWDLIPIIYLPLILTAWQYGFRGVLIFCAGQALLTLMLPAEIGFNRLSDLTRILLLATLRSIGLIMMGYIIARLVGEQRKQQRRLTRANTQLLHYASTLEQLSTSRERNRLARELHDTLAHTQSALAVQLEAVNALWGTDSDGAYTMLGQSLSTTRSGLVETRRALQALRASPLEDLGLLLAIRNLIDSFIERTGVQLDLHLPEQLNNISPNIEQCIYRVIQESLENVAAHANATRLSVQLKRTDHQLTLTITDDGQGFNPEDVDTDRQFGLMGMKERVEILGGTFKVTSKSGQGTKILLGMEDGYDSRTDL